MRIDSAFYRAICIVEQSVLHPTNNPHNTCIEGGTNAPLLHGQDSTYTGKKLLGVRATARD